MGKLGGRLRRWQVLVPAAALVIGAGAAVTWAVLPGCADAFGGSSAATPSAVPVPEDADETTDSNRDFAGDDMLGPPKWTVGSEGDLSVVGDRVLQDYLNTELMLDASTGNPLWSRPSKAAGAKPVPGAVLALSVADDEGRYARIEADTGEVAWCADLPQDVDHNANGTFTAASDEPVGVYVVQDPEGAAFLGAYDAGTGEPAWSVEVDKSTEEAVAGGGIAVTLHYEFGPSGSYGTGDGNWLLTGYDLDTGERRWQSDPIPFRGSPDPDNDHTAFMASLWGVRDGRILVAQRKELTSNVFGAVVAYDLDGTERWSAPTDTSSIGNGGFVLTEDLIVAPGHPGNTAEARHLDDGSLAWSTPVDELGPADIVLDHAGVSDTQLFLPGGNVPSAAVDLTTGASRPIAPVCYYLAVAADVLLCSTEGNGDSGGSTVGYPLLD